MTNLTDSNNAFKHWYLRSVDEIFSDLNSSQNGLNESSIQENLKKYGSNVIAQQEKNKVLKILFRNFNSLLIYVLLGASLISFFSNHMIEFIAIIVIIFITVFSGFIQEYNAGKSLEALAKLTVKYVFVIRDGVKKKIKSEDLVVGDIILFERGMIVPADIRIIESNNVSVNESILTGESDLKYKRNEPISEQNLFITEQHNMLFSGTSITNGNGKGIVVSTGLKSQIGKISAVLKKIGNEISPLQKQINAMSKKISFMVLFICILLFSIMMLKEFNIFESLVMISAVAVSGIPESFPLALTIALSTGVKKMAKKNAIVKDLASVETLGTCTVICTDKTGTLTENKMLAQKIYFSDDVELTYHGKDYEPFSKFTLKNKLVDKKTLNKYSQFFNTCILCNNSSTFLKPESGWILEGEPTEGALLTVAKAAGIEDEAVREIQKRLFEIPFDPFEKYMATINKNPSSKKLNTIYLKGAAEKILSMCSYFRDKKGHIKKLKKSDLERFEKQIHNYTNETYRVLGLATKNISASFKFKNADKDSKKLKSNYIFEGLIAIEDPVREEVKQAIKECNTANVKVIMITGDHKKTAMSVGKKLGIIKSLKDLVLEGSELDELTDEELDEIILKVSIFARTTPDHKFRIVESLQRCGEIVAMTGDGVNDAPALKKADIGVSMGKAGTDVAREASNMVLADDNFATIVNAIREGRSIYSNIRRFIYYLLVGNFTEVSLIVIAFLFGLLTPLTAIMILFVNLITSSLPAMALSIEPTHPKIMHQKPRNSKENLLSKYILLKIISVVPLLLLGTLGVFLWHLKYDFVSIEKVRTVVFVTLILFELFHVFNTRSLHSSIFNKNFFSNKYVFISVFISAILTLLAVQTQIGRLVFKTISLTGVEWLILVAISFTVILFSEMLKALVNSEIEEQRSLHMRI